MPAPQILKRKEVKKEVNQSETKTPSNKTELPTLVWINLDYKLTILASVEVKVPEQYIPMDATNLAVQFPVRSLSHLMHAT